MNPKYVLMVLLVLQALDVASTLWGIRLGAHESDNTIMSKIFKLAGAHWQAALVGLKVAFALFLLVFFRQIGVGVLCLIAVAYVAVLLNNARVIKKLLEKGTNEATSG